MQHTRVAQVNDPPTLLTIRADEKWNPIAPGVEIKNLYVDDASRTRSFLLRLQPGASLPEHEHSSDEECVMLEGEASLGRIVLRAGDYHAASKGARHGVLSTETGPYCTYVRHSLISIASTCPKRPRAVHLNDVTTRYVELSFA